MRMAEIGYEGPPPIDSYGGGGFRVAGAFHEGDMLLLGPAPARWAAEGFAPEAFGVVIEGAADLDVLLIGMGAEIAPLPGPARRALEAAGIGVEVMSTASACRTYNVLLAENRRVAAALIAV